MKPLKLTMQAFESYGRKTSIDFTRPAQQLFLISGDTGAGKTSICDALVFALYGEASAGSEDNKKKSSDLQSHYASYDTEPFVELEFSELRGGREQKYLVRRVPAHKRSKKRGSGLIDVNEELSLKLPDGSIFPGSKNETNAKLQQLVGLSKEQFMQIAMIAQGEFMELLRAKSREKKEIFRKLFDTGLYQKITEELENRRKAKLTEIAKIHTAFQTGAGRISVPQDYPEAEELRELKERVCKSQRLNVVDMEELLKMLEGLCAELNMKHRELEQQQLKASALRDKKRDAYTAGLSLSSAFIKLQEAKDKLSACEARREEMEKAEELAAKISSAYEILSLYRLCAEAEKQLEDTERQLKAEKALLPQLEGQLKKAQELLKAADEKRADLLSEYSRTAQSVEAALRLFGETEQAQRQLKAAEAQIELAQEKKAKAQEELLRFRDLKQRRSQRAAELEGAGERLYKWQLRRQNLDKLYKELKALKEAERQRESRQLEAEQASQTYLQLKDRYEQENSRYQQVYAAFLDAQAGVLAREKLRENEPCPVCGSLNHPRPCKLSSDSESLSRELVDELSEKAASLSQQTNRASQEAGKAAERLRQQEIQNLQALELLLSHMREEKLSLSEKPDIKEAGERLKDFEKSLEAQGQSIQAEAQELKTLESLLKNSQQQEEQLQEKLRQQEEGLNSAENKLTALKTRVSELLKQKSFESEQQARGLLTQAENKKQAGELEYKKADRAAKAGAESLNRAAALIERYSSELPILKESFREKREEYSKLLEEKKMSQELWQEICRSQPKAKAEQLSKAAAQFRSERAAAQGARESAEAAVKGHEKPELTKLKEEKEQAEAENSRIALLLNELKRCLQDNLSALGELSPNMQEREQLLKEFSKIDSLYSRLAGKLSGGRMDIETFVQRYYLNQALYSANLRFAQMSAGQFQLRMVHEEEAGEGRNRGLDLLVYSNVTGSEREVRTLSGGESFMAALSLALGMADQIQEKSSAISLDMMFIDEGFGTLDSHSRQQAVKVLKQMAGGKKLIGIISHVSELKQEIEDQLLVKKDEYGSSASWKIS